MADDRPEDRERKIRLAKQAQKLAALRADLDIGLKDLAEGRTSPFDAEEIIRLGRERLRRRTESG